MRWSANCYLSDHCCGRSYQTRTQRESWRTPLRQGANISRTARRANNGDQKCRLLYDDDDDAE